ncbi:UDP-N-acetylglucosamine--undecaprenyl-phosphate N-acetylglucosaminephosphotransferase [Shewanella sp. AS16]|uniref:UDP-N-acetylglucosamine--undecaprenyl-phosphate N-acetylglucosaminephosphotransferase n=1 Tax=Shewanella sp. AS16 TaxID=2907625 RepID=UPI001F268327|nr:UDP-N-acetylglucosamine--undecaprenyl-phosphate N-acetylglucosaminephosphotransferase [Shewanella sp. AS16]MCE9686740.1 UDP-N-acetylglucosamine--undecaprenyl-phosphate N-acetylglucosaminephosphotransferase [Shewanella sp. AS16]
MEYLVPFIAAFGLTCIAIKMLHPIAQHVGLVDLPNERKLHVGAVPLIGGVSIYCSVLLVSGIVIEQSQVFNLYLISAALILFLGVLDDKYDLSVRLRIVAQVITASILIFGAGQYLTSLGNIFYFFELKLGYIGVFVTVVAVIGAINAFNMVDGIDGLAGMLSLVTFSSLAILFYSAGNHWFMLPLLFIAAIMAYLVFNLRWPYASIEKVFMGDAGSMLIGLTVVWLLVLGVEADSQVFVPVTALYLIGLPLMDMAAIMYRRVKKGHSPFKPDRDHLHHIFERAGYSRKQTLVRISCASLVLALLGIAGEIFNAPEWLMFTGFLLIFAGYNWALAHVWQILTWIRRT